MARPLSRNQPASGAEAPRLMRFNVRVVPREALGAPPPVACSYARRGPAYAHHVFTECEDCGRDVMHLPGAPADAEKLCWGCALAPFNIDPED